MATHPTNEAVVFGQTYSSLDPKPFTFTADPHADIRVKAEPVLDDEGTTATKRKRESQDSMTLQPKRHRVQVPISEPASVPEARCYTPYPEAESEPYSPTDLNHSGTHQIDDVLQDMIQSSVKEMVAEIKRHVKHECESALDAAW